MDTKPRTLAVAVALLTLTSARIAAAQDQTPAQTPPAAQGPAAARTAAQTPEKAPAAAQTETATASAFTAEQLEQIVAPISLHPDSLLTMILMSSTYPLEIVEASRWVEKNPKLTGSALEAKLKEQDWDPSVKSMCGFPTVLKQMSDNLDWTQDLGDAFLGQKKELMQTVQAMRRKALEAGSLKTTEQQKVTDADKIIVIESTSPEVIYVPTYSPTVVYGGWYYPTYYYPPMYYGPPPGAALFAFSVGVAWGAGCWGNCNWGGNDIDIDIDRHNEFNRNTNVNPQRNNLDKAGGAKQSWNHSPEHRKGANYKNPQTAQKYGAKQGTSRVTKDQARGYDRAGSSSARTSQAKSGASTRPSTGSQTPRASTGASNRASSSSRPTTSNRSSSSSSALSGSRSPSLDRSASSRGAASRGGGMSRGGGGRRR